MLPFTIRFLDGVPASDQLAQAVRRAILAGELADGDRFPSVRTLSQQLKISPTTSHKAVAQLKGEGLLASQPGVGMIVRTGQLPNSAERLAMLTPALEQLIQEARDLQLSAKDLTSHLKQLWDQESQD